MNSIKRVLSQPELDNFTPKSIELKKGECVFHHPLAVHGSYPNKSPKPRRAAVINLFADGTRSSNGQELLKGVPLIEKDKKLQGQFFPLVHEER